MILSIKNKQRSQRRKYSDPKKKQVHKQRFEQLKIRNVIKTYLVYL